MPLTARTDPGPSISFDWGPVRERLLAECYRVLAAAPLLLAALALVLLAWCIGEWLARRAVVDRLARHNPFVRNLLTSTIKGGAVLLGLASGLQLMNATAIVGALLGTAGVVGIALGFAFKDIIENYIAGVLLSLRQPFRPHDHVKIAEHEGLVVAMTARATVLMTLDGNNLRVPNAIVFKSVLLNFSQNPSRRFEFDLQIPIEHGSKIDLATIKCRVQELGSVLNEPSAEVFVAAVSDTKLTLRVRGWVDQRNGDIEEVRGTALSATSALLAQLVQPGATQAASPSASPDGDVGGAAMPSSQRREQARQHLVRAGKATTHSGDLLDPSAPAE